MEKLLRWSSGNQMPAPERQGRERTTKLKTR